MLLGLEHWWLTVQYRAYGDGVVFGLVSIMVITVVVIIGDGPYAWLGFILFMDVGLWLLIRDCCGDGVVVVVKK